MASAAGWLNTDREGGRLVVVAGGEWGVTKIADFDQRLALLETAGMRTARIDIVALESLDTAAAWVLHRTLVRLREQGLDAEIAGASPAHAALLERVASSDV